MIQVQGLTKTFSDSKRGAVHAVDRVSFEVRSGEIFGLLGPNGAGKTTTLRMLATVMKPSAGTAILNGHDILKEPEAVRSSIGFLSADMGLYLRLSAREVLTFFGELNGIRGAALAKRSEEIFSLLNMSGFGDTKIDSLSTGMRQRVAIARTLIHDPPILILDEPASGLDVPTAHVIEEFILKARDSGKAVVLSTHVMEEAEYLCDRMAVIHEGRVKIVGTMEDLRAATGKQRLREIFLDLLGIDTAVRRVHES
ncbi:MAG: ATP-binding cassette domain-containing protein [Bryobacteraceae bacterium]|jgi:sodium transport system ATP-binding protein